MMSVLLAGHRLYRLLLFLYPGEFRKAYADEMHLLFREVCLEQWHRHGWAGLVGFWLEATFDLLWSAFLLRSERVAVAAFASAAATLLYGVALLVVEPRLSSAANHAPAAPVAFGIAVQGLLQTFALVWMFVLCGLLFFPRTSRATGVVLSLVEASEAVARSSTRVHLDA